MKKHKVCVVCGEKGTPENHMSRDHVVSRLVLRMTLGREMYQKFCTETRKLNLQPMCALHNGSKGHRVTDLRSQGEHHKLVKALRQYGIADQIKFEDPYDVFGEDIYKGGRLWLK